MSRSAHLRDIGETQRRRHSALDARVPVRQLRLGRRRLRRAARRGARARHRDPRPRRGRRPRRARSRGPRPTRSGWPAATDRSRSSPGWRSSATSRSPASRSGRATTSRATSASIATTRSARSTALVDGEERRIDVGRANDRLFLNNVSLGVYARLVHRREHHRRRSNAFARLRALAIVVTHRHARRHHGRRRADRGAGRARLEQRLRRSRCCRSASAQRLDEGRLHLYAPQGVLRSNWDERDGEPFTIDARAGRLHAAVDGEPEELETPIEFRVEPRALRVPRCRAAQLA